MMQIFQYFIGLGRPIEGVTPIEALSHGCIYLNPKLHGPDQKDLQNRKKSTSRLVSFDH